MTHKDVVERLRDITGWPGDHGDVGLCMEAANEIERLRLTDAERAAVGVAIRCVDAVCSWKAPQDALREKMIEHTSTLRGLLKRLG